MMLQGGRIDESKTLDGVQPFVVAAAVLHTWNMLQTSFAGGLAMNTEEGDTVSLELMLSRNELRTWDEAFVALNMFCVMLRDVRTYCERGIARGHFKDLPRELREVILSSMTKEIIEDTAVFVALILMAHEADFPGSIMNAVSVFTGNSNPS